MEQLKLRFQMYKQHFFIFFSIVKLTKSVDLAEVTNIRTAKEFHVARASFRQDQQPRSFYDPLLIFMMRYQKQMELPKTKSKTD